MQERDVRVVDPCLAIPVQTAKDELPHGQGQYLARM